MRCNCHICKVNKYRIENNIPISILCENFKIKDPKKLLELLPDILKECTDEGKPETK